MTLVGLLVNTMGMVILTATIVHRTVAALGAQRF